MALTRGGNFVVANGAQLSTQNDLGIVDGSWEIVGFEIDTTIVSTSMTFLASIDGVTFQTLNTQAGSPLSVTITGNATIGLSQDVRAQLGRWRYLQVKMGSAETNGCTVKTLIK